jgi:general secretion pathway protein H
LQSRRHVRGLTLVEVLIVVALIALLAGSVAFGPGFLRSSRLRAAATLMVSGVRTGVSRASTTGRAVRLVIDIDENKVLLEEANLRGFTRQKGDVAGGAEASTEAESKARAETERILEGPRAPRASFQPVASLRDPDTQSPGRELGAGVVVTSVQTEHDEEPVTSGRAYVYFWPGGVTERAAIQLKRTDAGDEGLTVLISALTGRAQIQRGKAVLPPPREDPEGEGVGEQEEE